VQCKGVVSNGDAENMKKRWSFLGGLCIFVCCCDSETLK
jgi:hypothetical protein